MNKYTDSEKAVVNFFVRYEFPEGIIKYLYMYIEKCRIYKNTKKMEDKGLAQVAFVPLNTQLKQWYVSGAYSEDTYWQGVNLLKELLYD